MQQDQTQELTLESASGTSTSQPKQQTTSLFCSKASLSVIPLASMFKLPAEAFKLLSVIWGSMTNTGRFPAKTSVSKATGLKVAQIDELTSYLCETGHLHKQGETYKVVMNPSVAFDAVPEVEPDDYKACAKVWSDLVGSVPNGRFQRALKPVLKEIGPREAAEGLRAYIASCDDKYPPSIEAYCQRWRLYQPKTNDWGIT